ncbi:HD domain-containing phosphohydrolase [Syntrophomonas wolfei]|uniref:Diguanylate cyclase with PAS/PAC and GAF sensors n=1 Tax=Syntrophomonas wolfei subsp. wolfei (strain DSM 2245B / Goettingen) TaxID=335541 RepID=Q0AWY0_SYNWW|nr:HD domain-containing phosphohydrolase [Syntrophomonas wolfei]ABI68774.1 diguanylate cyclase with PAS/PAC and GAF sensors [Syntrophomonas wolfei subsp. wolfei str. Goettingen G311]
MPKNDITDNFLGNFLELFRLSEEDLPLSEQKYRTIVENANDIISVHRASDLSYLYINSTGPKILGWSKKELIRKSPVNLIHPEDLTRALEKIKTAGIEDGCTCEYRFLKKDSQYLWLESNGKKIRFNAETVALLIYSRDISERKALEERVRQRLNLEEAITTASQLFLAADSVDLVKIMGIVGEAVTADRVYIFEFFDEGKKTSNTCEWCAVGIESAQEMLQDLDSSLFPWWLGRLKNGENIVIQDVNALPAEANNEKFLLQSQGIKSLLVVPIRLKNSELVGFLGFDDNQSTRKWLAEDIKTLRMLAEMIALYWTRCQVKNALRESEQRLASIIDFLPDATFAIDNQGRVIIWNRAMEEMSGIKGEDMLGKDNYEYALPFFSKRHPMLIDLVMNPDHPLKEKYLFLKKHDETLVGEIYSPQSGLYMFGTASPLYDANNRWVGAIESIRDVTERRRAEEKIRYLSHFDKLTGLYNRSFFEEEVKRLDKKEYLPISIIIGDVNGLKLVNDAFGHREGDRLLLRAAQILKDSCRQEDIIARWGGDEFIILLPNTYHQQAFHICQRIKNACQQSESEPIQVSIALGTASKETVDENIFTIIKETDDRMYSNKVQESKNTRNSFILSLENSLRNRTRKSQFYIVHKQETAKQLGLLLGLSKNELQNLLLLASLHDIGIITIPPEILFKAAALTPGEWEIIKKHPETGYRIAQSTPELLVIAEAILAHHERWDGSGYPQGIAGQEIPLGARILAIIDSYNAMISGRPYKAAISPSQALQEIHRCAGSQFDPDLVRLFLEIKKGISRRQ